ncbi:tRNA-dihydrouridine(47) synthase [NAD(P)(+)]-like isoform X2 [Latimeria chalumnae]|uniref:tRNA-dihydrouridine(47) synthase [NAD(P)(+)]-like isoform X2 n=1 Tax=Latimeria chalumnae TaxID=7897 RepID=UPI0003C13143|nr:PREDICTED: tRNA-dihydrouridine(47) synthase [NAD(P)(+)]-like isoform X2 [Latimeria chalumnae]|eukprot:XP_006002747.1 PREDICTED: tRNA-dihydrouridine(47) synthase [NAD(P)(+)]-like isoform X2 [Latimeria chalumnae]
MTESEDKQTTSSSMAGKPESESSDRGVAAIRSLYLTTKDKFHEHINAGRNDAESDQNSLENTTAEGATEGDFTEPQAKRRKLHDENGDDGKEKKEGEHSKKQKNRGQNKRRPHMKPTSYDDNKLCLSVTEDSAGKCLYGEKCRFMHDIHKYMAMKPADIGDRCYLYDTFGRCKYGVTCRFAKAHVGENYKNTVNEELIKQCERRVTTKNNLDKSLQHLLRKKKIVFEQSDKYLKELTNSKKAGSKAKESSFHQAKPVADEKVLMGVRRCDSLETKEADQVESRNTACVNVDLKSNSVEELKKTSLPEKKMTASNLGQEESSHVNSVTSTSEKTVGTVTDEDIIKLRPCEKKTLDFRDKLYLAPLTTLEGSFPDTMTKCAELLNQTIDVDFVDINVGCPIDLVYNKGGGCALMHRTNKFEQIVKGMNSVLDVPLTVKLRTGVQERTNIAHKLIPDLRNWGVSLVTLHGRSREQRYTKLADWDYIDYCSKVAQPMSLFGNGDILSFEDANRAKQTGVSGIMIARGALIKPWLFTEIKERRHWDISSSERFDILKNFTNYGLEHWGSDTQGVEKTRKFLLEWLSFLCRYIPVGVLEHVPQKINERPPYYLGRNYLETLMASQNIVDWIKISEMLLGPVPQNFIFLPKHKANSYK